MRKLLAVSCLVLAGPALAENDIEITPATSQSDFRAISEDLVAAIDYKSVVPAEATGILGFGVGLIFNNTSVSQKDWRNATFGGADISRINHVGVGVTKGLPGGVDLGLFYSEVTSSDVSMIGGEIRYAFLEGGVATPAVALRAAHVRTNGIDSFDLSSTSVDLSVSKGLAFLTPYAGIGYVFGTADPDGFLDKEEVNETKLFAGARISMGLVELTPEVQQIGDNTAINVRLGFSFAL